MTQRKSVCNISPNNINDNTNHNRHNNNNSSSISVAVFVVHTYHFSVSIWIPFNVCVYFVSVRMCLYPYENDLFSIFSLSHACVWLSLFPSLSFCVYLLFFSVRWKDYFIECVAKNGTGRRCRLRSHLRRCQWSQKSTATSPYRWAIGGHLLNVYCNMTTSWYIVVNTLQ